MIDNLLYKLRILILMIYVKITMIGYESKQKENCREICPENLSLGIDPLTY